MSDRPEPFARPARADRYKKIKQLDGIELDLFGCSMSNLVDILASPEANDIEEAKCHHCDTMVECRRIVAPFVACDECIKKHDNEEKRKRYLKRWESICPERFRTTDLNHADFPKAIYAKAKAEDPGKSLFLYGPSGACKTRVAFLLLKQAILRDQLVGVLWPERLSSLKTNFETTTFDRFAEYELLLLDDVLLTACREPRLLDTVKQLIDVRMRHNRPSIITSQIGEEGIKSGKEFGELKTADIERIDALVRRLRQDCTVISFAKADPQPGQSAF